MYERYFEKTRFANLFGEILAKKGKFQLKKFANLNLERKHKNGISYTKSSCISKMAGLSQSSKLLPTQFSHSL